MAERPIRGSCLCESVRFEVTGAPLAMSYCHCSRCRKAGGSAIVLVRGEDFRWIQGSELVTRYVPHAPFKHVRCFCSLCGTYLGEPEPDAKAFPVSAQALDDDPGVRPAFHEHVASKPAWYEITDGLPQHAGDPA